MSTFVGEIKLFAGNFIPEGWLACQGQTLAVSDYPALSSIIGAMYGGNGTTTFAIPDFRGRMAIGVGYGPGLTDRLQTQRGGVETVTLTTSEIPGHNHVLTSTPTVQNNLTTTSSGTILCSGTAGNTSDPTGAYPAATKAITGDNIYVNKSSAATDKMNDSAVSIDTKLEGDINIEVNSQCGLTGGGLSHENMSPWLCMQYIINWNGVYPNRT